MNISESPLFNPNWSPKAFCYLQDGHLLFPPVLYQGDGVDVDKRMLDGRKAAVCSLHALRFPMMSSLVAIGHLVFQSWHSLDFLNLATRGSWGQPWIHHFDRNQRWSRLQLFGCRISGGYDSRRNSRMSWDYIGGITASHRKPWLCSNKCHSNCFRPYAACSWVVCKDVTHLKGSPEIGWNSVSNLKFETVASAMRLSSQLKACTDAASWLLSPLPGQKRFQERLE